MTIFENLGNIGDFIGGVGVFVSLLYLVTQVRQNTNSQRLASIQQHKNGFIDEDVLNAYLARLQVTLRMSVARNMWRTGIKDGFPLDFQQHVQEHLDNDPT